MSKADYVKIRVGDDTYEINKDVAANAAIADAFLVSRSSHSIGISFVNQYLHWQAPVIVMSPEKAKALYGELGEAIAGIEGEQSGSN